MESKIKTETGFECEITEGMKESKISSLIKAFAEADLAFRRVCDLKAAGLYSRPIFGDMNWIAKNAQRI